MKPTNQPKIVYSEPDDYFPKDLRKEFKLGEYAEKETYAILHEKDPTDVDEERKQSDSLFDSNRYTKQENCADEKKRIDVKPVKKKEPSKKEIMKRLHDPNVSKEEKNDLMELLYKGIDCR